MAGREGMGGKEAWQTVSILESLLSLLPALGGGGCLLWAWAWGEGEGRLSVGVYAGEGGSSEFPWKYE